ncbi:MAG TPA: hypothetical protein PKM65_20555 [Spirochaetota bacterium]|nr:hypothetical protein [Spirochaetota bacterium]
MLQVKKIVKPKEPSRSGNAFHVEFFYKYKGRPMVRVAGNFLGGGFNISQNKVRAILDNAEALRGFVKGEYDQAILGLEEDEVVVVE